MIDLNILYLYSYTNISKVANMNKKNIPADKNDMDKPATPENKKEDQINTDMNTENDPLSNIYHDMLLQTVISIHPNQLNTMIALAIISYGH